MNDNNQNRCIYIQFKIKYVEIKILPKKMFISANYRRPHHIVYRKFMDHTSLCDEADDMLHIFASYNQIRTSGLTF